MYICDDDEPPILERSKSKFTFFVGGTLTDQVNNRHPGVHKLLDFTTDFTPFQDKFEGNQSDCNHKLYYQLEYTAELVHDLAQLKVSISIDGQPAGASPTIDFYHPRPPTMKPTPNTVEQYAPSRRRLLRRYIRRKELRQKNRQCDADRAD